tara:strand:+ start:632 stop:1144 length:513 start_codon:yes stop_codon:yes gene_type:complete
MKNFLLVIFLFFNFNNLFAENKIAYINVSYILNNSAVGLSINEHIKNIRDEKVEEFKIIEKQLSDMDKDILKKKNIVERNELQKDIDKLNLEIKKYRKKKKSFNDEINKKKLDYTKKVLQTMNPIISNYVEKNSITIVFDKKNVVVAKKELDITNPIMELLNKKLNKLDF